MYFYAHAFIQLQNVREIDGGSIRDITKKLLAVEIERHYTLHSIDQDIYSHWDCTNNSFICNFF